MAKLPRKRRVVGFGNMSNQTLLARLGRERKIADSEAGRSDPQARRQKRDEMIHRIVRILEKRGLYK